MKREPPGQAPRKPQPGRMRVTGRVLDPQGRPVPGAAVMVYSQLKQFDSPTSFESVGPVVINETRCEMLGGFQLDLPRTSSSRYDRLGVTAIAPGHGIGWGELDLDAEKPAGDVRLQPEQLIRGRLFDVQGRPVQGVVVNVRSIVRSVHGEPDGPNFLAQPLTELHAWPSSSPSDADGRIKLHGLATRPAMAKLADGTRPEPATKESIP